MTFLSQNTPAAFSVKSTAQPINGQSIHQTIQQLKGGHQDASSAIISNFKDDLRKMRGELEEEMEMEYGIGDAMTDYPVTIIIELNLSKQ